MAEPSKKQRSKKWKRRVFRLAMVFLILAVIAGWVIFSAPGVNSRWTRSAAAVFPEDRAEYDDVENPPLLGTASEGPGVPLDDLRITPHPEETGWVVTRSNAPVHGRNFTRVSRNDDPRDPWKVELSSGAELRLFEVWIQHAIGPEKMWNARFKPGEEKPFEERDFEARTDDAEAGRINIGVRFRAPGEIDRHVDAHAARDAKTKRRITNSWGSGENDAIKIDARTYHWHDGPVEFVFDVASGEPVVHEIDPNGPNARQLLDLGGGRQFRFLALAPGMINRSQAAYDHAKGEATRTLLADPDSLETHTHAIIALSHARSEFAFRIEALDEYGEVLRPAAVSQPHTITYARFKTPAESIKRLRFVFYPNFDRVLFTLPSVPGLPESNRGLTNLFDARIPFLVVKADYQLRSQITSTAQIEMEDVGEVVFPAGHFPKTFHDVSVAELLEEFDARHRGDPLTVVGNVIKPAPADPTWRDKLNEIVAKVRGWFGG